MKENSMKLYYRVESEGAVEYVPAGKKEIHAAGLAAARLQHLKATIGSASALIQYLGMTMRLLTEEQLRVIYVDNLNKIIKDEILSEGIEDQTAVYPKKIVRNALLSYATGIIVVHNHPTGQLRPWRTFLCW
jgi:DNA repair protein RadC